MGLFSWLFGSKSGDAASLDPAIAKRMGLAKGDLRSAREQLEGARQLWNKTKRCDQAAPILIGIIEDVDFSAYLQGAASILGEMSPLPRDLLSRLVKALESGMDDYPDMPAKVTLIAGALEKIASNKANTAAGALKAALPILKKALPLAPGPGHAEVLRDAISNIEDL